METVRVIINLEGIGRDLYGSILEVAVKEHYQIKPDFRDDIDFIYEEVVTQIGLVLDREFQDFSLELLTLIDYSRLRHISFLEDGRCQYEINQAAKKFGILLYGIISRYIDVGRSDSEIIPEVININDMILLVTTDGDYKL